MASEKQIEANRRNAQQSTGPRTEEGKKKSRLNAWRHGLTGHLDIMTGEQRQACDAFTSGIALSLKPVGALEDQLAHSIAASYWRMNRVAAIENTLLADGDFTLHTGAENPQFTDLARALGAVKAFIENPARFNLLTVYEMRLHRKAQSDLKQLRELQAERRAAEKDRVAAAQPVETEVPAPQNGFVCSAPADAPPEVLPPVILLNQSQPQALPAYPAGNLPPAEFAALHP